jgi:hypothetical protein
MPQGIRPLGPALQAQKRHEKEMHYRGTRGIVKRPPSQDGLEMDERVEAPTIAEYGTQIRSGLAVLQATSFATAPDQPLHSPLESWDSNNLARNGVNPLFFDPSADFKDIPNDLDWFFQDVLQKTPSAVSEYEAVSEPIGIFPYFQQDLDLALDSQRLDVNFIDPAIESRSSVRRDFEQSSSSAQRISYSSTIFISTIITHTLLFFIDPARSRLRWLSCFRSQSLLLGRHCQTNFDIATKVHHDLRFRMCRISQYHLCIFSHINLERDIPASGSSLVLADPAIDSGIWKMASTRKYHELAHIFHGTVITVRAIFLHDTCC